MSIYSANNNRSLIYQLATTPEDVVGFYKKNSDFPGYRSVKENVEEISFRSDSGIRIWYNNLPIPFDFHRQGSRFIYLLDVDNIVSMSGFTGIKPLFTKFIHITADTYPQVYDEIHRLLANIRDEYFSSAEFYELSIYSDIFKMFVLLGQDHLKKTDAFAGLNLITKKEYLHRFNSVLNYINEYFCEDLTLEMVAEHSGFSKFHFSRLFKKYTGTTFYDYLIYKRLQAAEQMLAEADLSVTEVALRTGFSSISTFNRTFKRKKNCTPREYRVMCRQHV